MTDPYVEIAHHLPNEVAIGGALISMMEPNPGHEHDYNRWYEDDHFYAGAMAGPWTFAGRRFVATRALRQRRAAVPHSVVQPPGAGCYISLYWVTQGHEADNARWSFLAMADALAPHGRGFQERTNVYSAFHRYRFGITGEAGPMRPHHALDVPFPGLLVEVVDAPSAERLPELEQWLRDDHLPHTLTGSPTRMVLAFTPEPLPSSLAVGSGYAPAPLPDGSDRQLCLLWFLERDPGEIGDAELRSHHAALGASGIAELRFSGPFVPTVIGTDRYVDELR